MIDREKVKALLESKGLTQTALANRIGIMQAHVSKIELGYVDTTTEILYTVDNSLSQNLSPKGYTANLQRRYK